MADLPCGVVSISIDVETNADRASHNGKAVQPLLVELVDRFRNYRAAATWAFGEPATTELAIQLGRRPSLHEVALLSDASSAGRDLPRTALVQGVVRRLQSAADAGISISTLCMPATWTPSHIDLLMKHGITVVRSQQFLRGSSHGDSRKALSGPLTSKSMGAGVQTVCYGLWHMPIAASLRGGGWLANLRQLRGVFRAVDQVARYDGVCHLHIDATSMARADFAGGLRAVDRLLRRLAHLRDAGQLVIETPRVTALRLQPKRMGAGARSILRAA